jgi:NAD(P)-dependent dehydrogenase (short-subunit alcohol dehydrogenase family)
MASETQVRTIQKPLTVSLPCAATMVRAGRYTEVHRPENLRGPGDARPTGIQIIKDENLEGKLSDKVIVITGASAGIGVETARALAATGARIFLTARDLPKAEDACRDFLEMGRVELLKMDNESLESVRSAAKEFLSRSESLNVLVNNAGIMATPEGKTKDGFESQFGVNHLAHFLFFNLLKDTLIKSSTPEFQSRVVNLSSAGHQMGEVQFGNYNFEDGSYNPLVGYGQAKTANIYMANEIETRYGKQGVHGLAVHPGGIATNLGRWIPKEALEQWMSAPGFMEKMKSLEQGAATTVLAAVGKEYEGKGRLYLNCCDTATEEDQVEEGYAKYAFDREKEEMLWKDSLKMIGMT